MGKIGIFGGSFDPVHYGHLLAIREFQRLEKLDRLFLIPAGDPPHKTLSATTPGGEVRLHLLRLAAEGIENVEILDSEIYREKKSYTYDTVTELKKRFPDDELCLLMGTDMFLSLPTWYRCNDLLKLVTVCVMQRSGISPEFSNDLAQKRTSWTEEYQTKIRFLPNKYLPLSSTTARRMLFFLCGKEYVPESVLQYILENRLYGTAPIEKPLPMEELRRIALSLHDAKRRAHVVGCSETARELAVHYGADPEDAARAGILHDVTKALRGEEQLRLCAKFGINTSEYGGEQVKLLHGKTAAAIARHIFKENDGICSAISWHTTGKGDMNLLEKIIYIADYIEPNRSFDGVEPLRELAYKDLDAAVLMGVEMTIELLERDKRVLNRYSVEARDYLLHKKGLV